LKVVKILNNNTILVSEDCVLSVLIGKGIGFASKKGFPPPSNLEYQKFVFDPDGTIQKYLDLLKEIPGDVFDAISEIINYAKKHLPRKFSSTVFWTLADHINFAIDRHAKQIDLRNTLHLEIKMFYPEEYQIGKASLEILKQKLGIQFVEDEASFIAMHFVNAELGENLPQTMRITTLISDVATIVGAKYNYQFDKESLNYFRFITHIKFFAQRLFSDELVVEKPDDTLYDVVKNAFPQYYDGAELIGQYVLDTYAKQIPKQELAYLTVHLKRVLDGQDSKERVTDSPGDSSTNPN
jgi:beta-glucoside operon transcriptional antiterminator